MSINKVIISGNITRDPEFKSGSGGFQYLRFGVAVNERDEVTWIVGTKN